MSSRALATTTTSSYYCYYHQVFEDAFVFKILVLLVHYRFYDSVLLTYLLYLTYKRHSYITYFRETVHELVVSLMLNAMFAADAADHRTEDEISPVQLLRYRRQSVHSCLAQLWSVIQSPHQRMNDA